MVITVTKESHTSLPKLSLNVQLIYLHYVSAVKGKIRPCALTEHHAMKAYWGSGSIAKLILDLGTRWM